MATLNSKKARAWSFLYYPDPVEDISFFETISNMHIPTLLSPLHDRDTWTKADEQKNPEHVEGQTKKAHYHGMILFSGPARLTQALEVLLPLGNNVPGHIEAVNDVTAMTRYFAHLDDPEKYQYNPEDIRAFCGAQISLEKALTAEQVNKIVVETLTWIRTCKIREYCELVDYAFKTRTDWIPVVISRVIFYRSYFASQKAKYERARIA